MEPDMIDMMGEAELRAELRKVLIENADLKKLKSHNSEYSAAQRIWCDYKESNMDVEYPCFEDYCRMRLNSQK